jgi:N-acyl-D-amino-acid deacylase
MPPFQCSLHLLAALLVLGAASASAQEYDLVVRHGRLVDGSGRPAFAGDVAVRDGRIAAVGRVDGRGRTEIDAAGQIVAPGFIDVHTHSEIILQLPLAENYVRMGVTTIVTGNCGGSKLDVAGFFRDVVATRVTLNVATLIGHNTIRGQAMGGGFMRPPTAAELAKMCAFVERAMQDGAVGLSTGLIYVPGTYAKSDEIVALAKVVAAHGGIYATHMRYENARILEAIEETCVIAREAGIRAEVSHLKLSDPNAWGRASEIISRLDRARADGLAIAHDQYSYTASATGLNSLLPADAREGGMKKFAERAKDPVQKARIVAAMKDTLQRSQRSDYTFAVIASYETEPALNGKTIAQAAKLKSGSDSLDAQIELLIELAANGGAKGVFHSMSEPDLQQFLVQPLTMIGSDGGPRALGDDVPHPRSYGNNARVLGRYVRELKLLTLEEAVRKMTALPAKTFRLGQRGELRPDYAADLVIFDPQTVADRATFEKPHQYAVGFSEVIVNGVPVIRRGEMTGERSGAPVKLSK